jgi:DNA-binding IclR family transcriptional regulator
MARLASSKSNEPDLKFSTSIQKALAVLSAFDGPYLSRGIGELGRQLKLPRSTLHRILKELTIWGFVRQLPSKRYQIGLRLFELGSRIAAEAQLRTPAIPHMHALYQRADCSVYLSVWTGSEVLHLDCLPSQSEAPLPARAGGTWAAHCASVGKILLAHAPRSDLERYLSRPLKAVTKYTITDKSELLAHLKQVRKLGYATTIQESLIGVYGVAAPIRDSTSKVVGSICIASRKEALLKRREEVMRTADAIGRDIVARRNISRG